MSLRPWGRNNLLEMIYVVEAGTMVVNILYYQEEDNGNVESLEE